MIAITNKERDRPAFARFLLDELRRDRPAFARFLLDELRRDSRNECKESGSELVIVQNLNRV